MNRRDFLTSAVAAIAAGAAPAGVPCDIWSSNDGDCPRAASFKYADPSVNRAPNPIGPRNFCKEHTGCATRDLVPVGA